MSNNQNNDNNNKKNNNTNEDINPVSPKPFLSSDEHLSLHNKPLSSSSNEPCDRNYILAKPVTEGDYVGEAQADPTTTSSSFCCHMSLSQLCHRTSSLPENLSTMMGKKRTKDDQEIDLQPQGFSKKLRTSSQQSNSVLNHGASSLPCLRTSIMETSTNDLLAEVEAELFRRIVEDDQADTWQHQRQRQRQRVSNRRLWNPSENNRIAQAFRAYGVPDTTDYTRQILREVSETESGIFSIENTRSVEDMSWSSQQQQEEQQEEEPVHPSSLYQERSYASITIQPSHQPGCGLSFASMTSLECFHNDNVAPTRHDNGCQQENNEEYKSVVEEEESAMNEEDELGLSLPETIMSPIFRDAVCAGVDVLQPLPETKMNNLF